MTGSERSAIRADLSWLSRRAISTRLSRYHSIVGRVGSRFVRVIYPEVLVAETRVGIVGADMHGDDIRTVIDDLVYALQRVVRQITVDAVVGDHDAAPGQALLEEPYVVRADLPLGRCCRPGS
nr:hypothetical protein [Kribbella sp. VKM Ac-2568]